MYPGNTIRKYFIDVEKEQISFMKDYVDPKISIPICVKSSMKDHFDAERQGSQHN